jgi:hypothetical protein
MTDTLTQTSSDVSHHSSINPINTRINKRYSPINRLTMNRQSCNRINFNHSTNGHSKERQALRLVKSMQAGKASETAGAAEFAEATGVAGIVFASDVP